MEEVTSGERETAKAQVQPMRSTAYFKCGKEGHRAAECQPNCPAKKGDQTLGGKSMRQQSHVKEMALKSLEIIEFTPSPK